MFDKILRFFGVCRVADMSGVPVERELSKASSTLPRFAVVPPRVCDNPRFSKRSFLSKYEFAFLRVLSDHLPPEYLILPKVGLWGVVRNLHRQDWPKISQKQLDFVIVTADYEIVCCIELDDPSHFAKSARCRDDSKDEILSEAGIHLYRVMVQDVYDVAEIRRFVSFVLSLEV